jgi:RimJ/RimL family protein N-acetyltransferase
MPKPEDKKELIDFANIFTLSKYHSDPFLPIDSAEKLYRAWLANAFDLKYGDAVFIVKISGEIAGFTSIRKVDSILNIDLTAIKDKFYGRGVADSLIQRVLEYAFDNKLSAITTTTQLYNRSSLNLHLRHGFELLSTDVTMSKGVTWYPDRQ